jgi:hypothetical protein
LQRFDSWQVAALCGSGRTNSKTADVSVAAEELERQPSDHQRRWGNPLCTQKTTSL